MTLIPAPKYASRHSASATASPITDPSPYIGRHRAPEPTLLPELLAYVVRGERARRRAGELEGLHA